jgi:hypothetical protein
MRNRTSAIFSGLGIIALLLTLTPDPAAARGGFGGFGGGGFRGGGFGGFGGGFRSGGFAGARAMAIGRPGWGGGIRPGWGGGWRGGWGGWGWGWPVAAGVAAGVALAGPWGYDYGGDCTYWNGYGWVNACYGPYGYGGYGGYGW